MTVRTSIFFTVLSLHIAPGQSVEPWTWRNPTPQGNDLNFVRVSPAGVTYVGGEAGAFLATMDYGATWSLDFNPRGLVRLYSMEIVSEDTMYLTGDDLSGAGGILKTTNGGASWSRLQTGTIAPLYDIRFRTSMFGVACGTNGIIIRTTDGGQSWTQLVTGHSETVLSIDFRSELIGTAALEGGLILHTEDGGETWGEIVASTTGSVRSIRYNAAGVGMAVGDAGLVFQHPIDEGSWAPLSGSPVASPVYMQWFGVHTAIMAARDGIIARTTNGGSTWDTTYSGFPSTIASLAGRDTSHLWICGSGGYSSYSSDAGRTWTHPSPAFEGVVSQVFTTSSRRAIALTNGPLVFTSEYPGDAWQSLESDLPIIPVAAILLDDSTLIAAGTAGSVYRSVDGGKSWGFVASATSSNIYGSSHRGDSVLLVGESGTVLRSTDKGVSFETVPSSTASTLRAVAFANDTLAVAVGNGGTLLRSENAGQSWVQINTPVTRILRAVSFGSSLIGVAGGSPEDSGSAPTIIRTSDGGLSWTRELIPSPMLAHPPGWIVLNAIAKRSESEYLAGTVEGILLQTTDGGNTWKELRVGASRDILSLGWNHDYWIAVGAGGMILESPRDTTVVSVQDPQQSKIPTSSLLMGVYPNPFNPITTIRIVADMDGEAGLALYTLTGRRIGELFRGNLRQGTTRSVSLDGTYLSTGMYIVTLRMGQSSISRKILLLR